MVAIFRPIFAMLPIRWGFVLLVMASASRVPGTKILTLVYASVAVRREAKWPPKRLSGRLTDRFPVQAAQVLLSIGAVSEGTEMLGHASAAVRSGRASRSLAEVLFGVEEFALALPFLVRWYDPEMLLQRALLELVVGNERKAIRLLTAAVDGLPSWMAPHQNLAARTPMAYVAHPLDINAGTQGRLYDAYNYIGQRVTHVGAGHLGGRLFAGALQAQERLRSSWPKLSDGLQARFAEWGIELDQLRILPPEWVTQIGHQGMLDFQLRMREIGWWQGSAILLAPYQRVANQALLSLFEQRCELLFGLDCGAGLFAELTSLQRYCGMSFNVFKLPSGEIVPWQEAGAAMICQWEAEGRGYPLREEYDRHLGSLDPVQANFAEMKTRWGMAPNDWYVCLHLRDASHYGEIEGVGQTHRNAEVANYLPMIEHITRQGGWVVKLGGPRSPKLPSMKCVVDYARGPFKSDIMDLQLIRQCRWFIGTTSGLTNLAVSFGVPCALVNCISVDAQLWGNRVRFAFKPVRTYEGRMLSQRELTSSPWRWRVFSAEVMLRHRAVPATNTSDEVLETVKEVELLADGSPSDSGGQDATSLIEKWRVCLDLPHFYGNAQPSAYYLQKYEREFLGNN
jgi:putative glycosyltransferase (TIGR04372 family)